MSRKQNVRTVHAGVCWRSTATRVAMLVLAAGMVGCETDSFFDPSMVGRWERTPTELPILERLDVIEDDRGDFTEATDVTPADLQPVIEDYRFGPGDLVRVETWDLFGRDQLVPFERLVDSRGMIDLGIIGEVRAQGLTPIGLRTAIEAAIRRQGLIHDPVVSVLPLQRRQMTFSIFGGAIGGAGTLVITKPDYRLLQAITDAGGILETIPYVYVIRQIPLTEATQMGITPEGEPYVPPKVEEIDPEEQRTLEQLLEELQSSLEDRPGRISPFMAPGEVHRRPSRVRRPEPQPEPQPDPVDVPEVLEEPPPLELPEDEPPVEYEPEAVVEDEPLIAEELPAPVDDPPIPLIELAPETEPSVEVPTDFPEETMHPAPLPELLPEWHLEPDFLADDEEEGEEPLVDLPSLEPDPAVERAPLPTPYIFVNGEWVPAHRLRPTEDSPLVDDGPVVTLDPITGEMMTQRVIRVPLKPLLRGEAQYNLVIRPGDMIRVPTPPTGNLYMGGMVNRPGTYNLPITGRMTMKQAIFAAGGLNALAIPERVDLIRRVGETREATVRLNLRAIFEGTEPDLFIKPNDMVNVGTNWVAAPLAVARNGFRVTYGFGFLLDRNFGNDVFGPPPVRRLD